MSSKVRVTESGGRDRIPLSRLDSLVKLMSAGRKLSAILEVGGRDGENVVASKQGFDRRGERRMDWDTGKLSGLELSNERSVFDEVEVVERQEEAREDEAEEEDEERSGEKLL